ncbi:tRNA-splicing endonuclease subunit Sen2 [Pelobates cultripes]|uniref:tRNA-splicing endonuclease subunit Sen2 n=1 Tax=Pelobates cultripes TaxID=61616 RepID=A0AAD1WM02_PELCU|nr:tRNA-splicing endonuclease subunit Sen2 [Pelobates cultripes]
MVLNSLGPSAKIFDMVEATLSDGTPVDLLAIREWAQHSICLIGNSNAALSTERRKAILMKIDPKLINMAISEPGPQAKGLLFRDNFVKELGTYGYFGKGILSRSRPQYSIAQQDLLSQWRASKGKLPVISSKKYQCHVEWARGLLGAQGLDLASVTKILDNYTNPINLLSEDYDPDESRIDPGHDIKDDVEAKPILEGNPVYDPLANYALTEVDTHNTVEEWDKEVLEKMHCHKHDDFIIHCGCRPPKKNKTDQSISGSMGKQTCEYVLVEEEELNDCPAEADIDREKGAKKLLVCRRNPFRVFEYLQLSREEAFFLAYSFGCLTVRYNKEPLLILKLWEIFIDAQPNFPSTYMAYHHFRSKGWVPKAGLKYGTDLLLYRKGPPFYHASYSVIVEFVNENFEGHSLRPLTWKSLAGLNRTTVNVSKELLFCYLIKPPGFTEKDLLSPECIKKIKVQELILNRWIASRERIDQDEL